MEKRIFSEGIPANTEAYRAKQTFEDATVVADVEEVEQVAEPSQASLAPSRVWGRLFLGALALFSVAVVAQSVQWLWDSVQAHHWIEVALAIACCAMSLAGIGAIINEWRKLRWLRKHHDAQQVSQTLWQENDPASGQQAVDFCKARLLALAKTPSIQQHEQRWLQQLDDAYQSREVLLLFSQTVLSPIDRQVKRLISQHASENAVLVAISPLAIADVLMVAWRHIALVNKISQAYGMELGYFSRLRLFRMVLTNMVFAGATEVATDLGTEFFSQNLTAKLSMRAAQGIGVGLLTARLGIKAMEFCRPVVFQRDERPTLSVVRQELLGVLKDRLFGQSAEKVTEYVNTK